MSLPTSPRGVPRAVLDTSVLLSEHRHWLWLLAKQGRYEAAWSTWIVAELVRIRVEHSIAKNVERSVYRQRINDLVHRLSEIMVIVNYRDAPTERLLSDPDDEPILATALAARAGIIVSLNTRDFPVEGRAQGVRFMTPAEFLSALAEFHGDDLIPDSPSQTGRHLP